MIRLRDYTAARPFFAGRRENTLIRSCLEGYQGGIWADRADNPRTLLMISCDFSFFGGEPDDRVFREFPWDATGGYTLFTPHTAEWEKLTAQYFPDTEPSERYAIRHEGDVFDRDRLRGLLDALPEGYTLHRIDEALYRMTFTTDWSCDFCSHFKDYAEFARLGGGFCILHDGKIVSGCSSYARYADGIELEVDTDPAFFRKGLARICSAAMILDCLSRGLYPSWDASGMISVQLAEGLGYHRQEPYRCYWVSAATSIMY